MSHEARRKTLLLVLSVALLAVLLTLPTTPSNASALQQTATVRPTLTPTPLSGGATPAPPVSSAGGNPSIAGYAWVNGDIFVPAVGVSVRFAGEGFELKTQTDVNGYFQFEQVGQDIGFLNIGGDDSTWKASVRDVALSARPGQSLRVNFSASQALPATGPAVVTIAVKPATFGAGQTISVTVKATNSTSQKLSGVWLTHLLPDGLNVSGLTTDRGEALSVGQLAMANLGDFAPGDTATFTIIAAAPADGAPQGRFSAVVSLFSREGVAVQASTSLQGMGGPSALPVTGMGDWLMWIGLMLAALLVGANFARRRSAGRSGA